MDENYNEENFDEQEKQNIGRRNDTGVVGRLNQFSSGFKAGLLGTEDKTKERINKRGTNEPRGVDKESGKMKPDEDNKKPGDKPGLEKKDGLENKDKNQQNGLGKANKKKNDLPSKLGETANEAAEAVAKVKKMKLTLLKLKIAGIALGIFATIFVIAYVYTVLDNFFTSVVLNFFIPEQKEDELEGLYTDSKYLRDPNTGEMYTWPELIKVLNDDNACEPNLWERIKEGLGIYGDEFKDPCALMRYIKKKVERYETTYLKKNTGTKEPNKLDRALILGTIFYGYDSQATYDSYSTPPIKKDEKGDTFTSASDHYETLKNIIKDGKLTKLDVDRIIQSTIFEDIYPYFTWVIRTEQRRDSNGNTYTVKVGYCDVEVVERYKYSRDKWEMFLRWNDEYDAFSGDDNKGKVRAKLFSVPGYIRINGTKQLDWKSKVSATNVFTLTGTGYTYDTSMNNAWNATSEKCNGTIPESALYGEVDELDGSVSKAHHYFIDREFDKVVDTTIYFQKIEDVYTQNKDVFKSRNIKYTLPGPIVSTNYVEFEYKHGFGYINFPSFKQADEDSNLPTFNYDDAISPKKVEEIVLEVKDRKGEINNTLFLKDLDSVQYGENGYWDEDGNYIEGIDPDLDNENVITNANCKEFLTSDLEDITVKMTDCDGNAQESVSFKEYVIGTVKAEIDNSTNTNYALTQMIANLNFAMSRSGNNRKGSTINMRNGDCDQLFSSPTKGSYYKYSNSTLCIPKKNQYCMNVYQGKAPDDSYKVWKNPMSDSEYKRYEALYEIAKNYLVIKNNDIFQTGYGSERSKGWEASANAGENFIEILKKTYGDVDIIECSGSNSTDNNYDSSYAGKGCVGIVEAAQRELNNLGNQYINWYNKQVGTSFDENSTAWCAIFVSWVANKTGYAGVDIPVSAAVDGMESYFRSRGSYHGVSSGYIPKAGDIIVWKNGMSHVSIVKSYDPNTKTLVTIGGNEGNKVTETTWASGAFPAGISGFGSINCK